MNTCVKIRKAFKCSIACIISLISICYIFPCTALASSNWSGLYQASVYGPGIDNEYEMTATSKLITYNTCYIAVPMTRVVSKTYWKQHNGKENNLFYYGEKLKLRHKSHGIKYYSKVTVEDCGGFASYGRYRNGVWIPRMFDCTIAVKNDLHLNDLGLVKYKVL